MELRRRALGLAVGLTWGLSILLVTWWLLIWNSTGNTISKLGGIFWGYTYSWFGGIVGFIWGFVFGFILGFLIASFYNIALKFFNKPKPVS